MEIPDGTQPNGVKTVINLDAERIADNIIKRYEPVLQEAVALPVKTQSLDAEERLAKAARDGVDIVLLSNEPVRIIVDGSNVAYYIGEETLREPLSNNQAVGNSIETQKPAPLKPNEISPAISPMDYEYDWGEEEDWTREVYPKIDPLGHSG